MPQRIESHQRLSVNGRDRAPPLKGHPISKKVRHR